MPQNKVATVGHFSNATIAQLSYSVDPQGELIVGGQYQGQNITTTIGAVAPYLLFFSPSTLQVFAVQNVMTDLAPYPDAQFVDFIQTVS